MTLAEVTAVLVVNFTGCGFFLNAHALALLRHYCPPQWAIWWIIVNARPPAGMRFLKICADVLVDVID